MPIRFISCIAIMATVFLASCSSPFVMSSQPDKNLTIRASLPVFPVAASRASTPGSEGGAPRLLLPTAQTLRVRLTPDNGGDALEGGPSPVVDGTATISLRTVPQGRYTIMAEAMDASDQVVFSQTASNVAVGNAADSITLSLVPTGASGTALVPESVSEINMGVLPVGQSRSWLLASESPLLSSGSVFLSNLATTTHVYLLSTRGALLGHWQGGTSRFPTSLIPSGKPVYLTVFNDGASPQPAARVFAGPKMVSIPSGVEPSTGVPVNQFRMASTEVTQEQFRHLMGYNYSESGQIGDTIPVGDVTMYDAMAYCNALSALEGLDPVYVLSGIGYYGGAYAGSIQSATISADFTKNGYRLPSLSERIWAARGGSTTTYHWGNLAAAGDAYEWHSGNSGNNFHPVAGKLPNGYGLYDMGGNMYEWSWGGDNPVLPGSARSGGRSRSLLTDNQFSTYSFGIDPERGGGMEYFDHGFRVVRNDVSSPPTMGTQFSYDFESLALGSLDGQDGWITTNYVGAYMEVITSTLGANTTKVAHNPVGSLPGDGVSASRPLGMAFNPGKRYLVKADLFTGSYGNTVGFAHDANADGKCSRDGSPGEMAFGMSPSTVNIRFYLPDGSYRDVAHSYGWGQWVESVMFLDFPANRFTVYTRLPGDVWTRNMSNEPLGVQQGAADRKNPANWNLLYLHFEHVGYADNILIKEFN